MILILIGIATAWLALSVSAALLFARMATLNQGHESSERQERSLPQLQLLSSPQPERERAA